MTNKEMYSTFNKLILVNILCVFILIINVFLITIYNQDILLVIISAIFTYLNLILIAYKEHNSNILDYHNGKEFNKLKIYCSIILILNIAISLNINYSI